MDWIKARRRLRSNVGVDWLPTRIWETIDNSERLYIACSGGADSVFLTLFFSTEELRDRLTVLHFNHRLRGEESDEDEFFVQELCSSLGLAFLSDSWERSDGGGPISEELARDARMGFFAKTIGKHIVDSLILTGHHADDVAETLLMRLSRGSGLQGICAPREFSQGIAGLCFARPLLKLRREEIVKGLSDAKATWREDNSNQTDQFFRNRLRKNVIPAWEEAAERTVSGGASMSRELLEEDWIALEQFFELKWGEIEIKEGVIDWERLAKEPRAIQRRALSRLVSGGSNAPLASQAMEGVLESIRCCKSFKVSIEHGRWIVGSSGEKVWISKIGKNVDWKSQAVPEGVAVYFPGGGKLLVQEVEIDGEMLDKVRSGDFSHENDVYLSLKAKQRLFVEVRIWKQGDAYQPMGSDSVVKLKKLFIDRKIPREERRTNPIITATDGEILWVPGLPPSKNYQLSEIATRALQLTYEK